MAAIKARRGRWGKKKMAEQGSLQGLRGQKRITQGGPGRESRMEAISKKVAVQALHQ